MRATSLLAVAITAFCFNAACDCHAADQPPTTSKTETGEPAVPFDDAVALAKEHLKDKGLDKSFFIRSVRYEIYGKESPRWMFILSPKKVRALKAEPGLVVKMDRSVELIKGR